MNVGPALLLAILTSLSSPDALAPAREAFAREDWAAAEARALEAAAPPREGEALYLAGLARFRAGKPGAALEALDRAAAAPDPPDRGLWAYNRAACLYELGRFAEAVEGFVEAARLDPAVEAAALANAGFAALDAGAPERARALAAQARAVATGGVLALVQELEGLLASTAGTGPAAPAAPEATATAAASTAASSAAAEHEAGLAAWDRGDFAEARRRFEQAAALDPAAARSLIMAGAAAERAGDRAAARATLGLALTRPLDEADRRLALDHLDAASTGLAARGAGWEGLLRAGGGFDDNVLQSGAGGAGGMAERMAASAGPVGSALLSAGGGLAHRWRLAPALRLEAAWGFDEVAYLAAAAEDSSLQQHLLAATLEWAPGPLRLGLSASGLLALAGLSDLRVEQAGGGAGASAALDWERGAATRLDLEWLGRTAPRAEFGYLAGDRLEAGLTHAERLGPVTLALSGRLRLERLGTLRQATAVPLPPGVCDFGCTRSYVIPYGHRAAVLALSAQAPVGGRLTLALSAGWERRRYDADGSLEVVRLDGDVLRLDVRRRLDDRAFGAAAASLRLGDHLSLSLRWDLLRSWSNVARGGRLGPGDGCVGPAFSCHALDEDDKNYLKQAVGLEAVVGF